MPVRKASLDTSRPQPKKVIEREGPANILHGHASGVEQDGQVDEQIGEQRHPLTTLELKSARSSGRVEPDVGRQLVAHLQRTASKHWALRRTRSGTRCSARLWRTAGTRSGSRPRAPREEHPKAEVRTMTTMLKVVSDAESAGAPKACEPPGIGPTQRGVGPCLRSLGRRVDRCCVGPRKWRRGSRREDLGVGQGSNFKARTPEEDG